MGDSMMEPNDIAGLAKRVHDAERWDLGARSTRETRNAFWARVVGIVHHGHPVYNAAPDPRWHLKSGGGGRPQSDDVAVRMPDRHFWDFIGGVGTDGYTFGASGDHGPLPPEQPVFPPPVPDGGGASVPAPVSDLWTATHQSIRKRLGDADTRKIAEQLAYSFPAETWGQKRADATRPISNDVIARKVDGVLWGVRVVPMTLSDPFKLHDQVFVPVQAVNHLGDVVAPPAPVEPPQKPIEPPVADATLAAIRDAQNATNVRLFALAEALGRHGEALQAKLDALSAKVDGQRQEVIAAVKGQSYDIDASAGYLGKVRGTIRPKP